MNHRTIVGSLYDGLQVIRTGRCVNGVRRYSISVVSNRPSFDLSIYLAKTHQDVLEDRCTPLLVAGGGGGGGGFLTENKTCLNMEESR